MRGQRERERDGYQMRGEKMEMTYFSEKGQRGNGRGVKEQMFFFFRSSEKTIADIYEAFF